MIEKCETCRHWNKKVSSDYGNGFFCMAINNAGDGEGPAWLETDAPANYMLVTRADFGCALHQPLEEKIS